MEPLKFLEAIDWAKKRNVILPDKYYSEANKAYRTLTFSIAGINNLNTLTKTLNSLVDSLENGTSFNEWKDNIKSTLNLSDSRLSTIYYTNIQSAYNSGIYQRQEENTDINPIYMYSAVNDGSTRPSHRRWDGYLAKYDDVFWQTHTPLCGYNCRCRRIALGVEQAKSLGYGKQPKPEGMPDKGFDYNKTLGLKQGVILAQNKAKEGITLAENRLNKYYSKDGSNKSSLLYSIFLRWIGLQKIKE
jgi:SPP1 gp7 family putative phage head morphogenesis protein